MRVLIDARISPGGVMGGVEQYISGLVWGLGSLTDGNEEYVIVSSLNENHWLKPFLGPNQILADAPMRLSRRFPRVHRTLAKARDSTAASIKRPIFQIPRSSGFYESLGVQVLHIPHQRFVQSNLPTIYNPHDLQHLYYPQFFEPQEARRRDVVYRTGAVNSRIVMLLSEEAAKTVREKFGVDESKIAVVPPAPAIHMPCHCPASVPEGLPDSFILYPAQTWPHKNHIGLLRALQIIRRREGISIDLVLTGRKNAFWPEVLRKIEELDLKRQVFALGFQSQCELSALYRSAKLVVLPSLFEGGGLPVLEAFAEGTPVICSASTSLEEYGGNATLVFDPRDPEQIADSILQVFLNDSLRSKLRALGHARATEFSWESTAIRCREIYRAVAT